MENSITTSALQALKVGSEEREERLQPYLVEHLWDQPAIYCGTYGKYNNGSLDGAWLDLEAFDSYDEFLEICALLHDDEHWILEQISRLSTLDLEKRIIPSSCSKIIKAFPENGTMKAA